MTLELGATIWIPCEVTPAIFPDERRVSIDSPSGRWVGCVSLNQLRDEISSGSTAVRATVMEVAQGTFAARLPGQTMRRQYLALTEALGQRLEHA